MHLKCNDQLLGAKDLSVETRNSCPMCRAPYAAKGSKEYIESRSGAPLPPVHRFKSKQQDGPVPLGNKESFGFSIHLGCITQANPSSTLVFAN